MTVVGLVQLPPFPNGRPETGPMQFGDDWPGIFVRGDNALFHAAAIDRILKATSPDASGFRAMPPELWADRFMLEGLAALLRSCAAGDTGWPP